MRVFHNGRQWRFVIVSLLLLVWTALFEVTRGEILTQTISRIVNKLGQNYAFATDEFGATPAANALLNFLSLVRQRSAGNGIPQCPCVMPLGSDKCIAYDARFQAANFEEAILTFVDTSMDPRIFDERVGGPITPNTFRCSSEECRQCVGMLVLRLRQVGLISDELNFPFQVPDQTALRPDACPRLRMSHAVPLQAVPPVPAYVERLIDEGARFMPIFDAVLSPFRQQVEQVLMWNRQVGRRPLITRFIQESQNIGGRTVSSAVRANQLRRQQERWEHEQHGMELGQQQQDLRRRKQQGRQQEEQQRRREEERRRNQDQNHREQEQRREHYERGHVSLPFSMPSPRLIPARRVGQSSSPNRGLTATSTANLNPLLSNVRREGQAQRGANGDSRRIPTEGRQRQAQPRVPSARTQANARTQTENQNTPVQSRPQQSRYQQPQQQQQIRPPQTQVQRQINPQIPTKQQSQSQQQFPQPQQQQRFWNGQQQLTAQPQPQQQQIRPPQTQVQRQINSQIPTQQQSQFVQQTQTQIQSGQSAQFQPQIGNNPARSTLQNFQNLVQNPLINTAQNLVQGWNTKISMSPQQTRQTQSQLFPQSQSQQQFVHLPQHHQQQQQQFWNEQQMAQPQQFWNGQQSVQQAAQWQPQTQFAQNQWNSQLGAGASPSQWNGASWGGTPALYGGGGFSYGTPGSSGGFGGNQEGFGHLGGIGLRQRTKRQLDERIIGQRFVISCVERGEVETEDTDFLNLCTVCWTWRKLPEEYFPRLLNELVCNENDFCLSGWGECRQRYRNVDVLRKVNGDWRPTTVSTASCCDCKVKAGSQIHSLVTGKNK